ncbi:oxidative stress-induced growth inhibitor 1 isoform X2 [Calliopsis andreniformis]
MQNCCDDDDNDVVYKDVVIVGNGPSGICLSYMLAGNWPYCTGEPHPGDEMLTARLHFSTRAENESCNHEECKYEEKSTNGTSNQWQSKSERCEKSPGRGLAGNTRCKLECLSSGLEGRQGGRPLALLMDQLQHPCVDAGMDVPSLLTWESAEQHTEHKIIDHVVLGKGQPGGAWQSMDPNVLTISLNRWMSLPDLDIRQWEMLVESEKLQNTDSLEGDELRDYTFQEKPLSACKAIGRISVGTVAAYYRDYVRRKGLEQYFRCGTVVTSVRPVSSSSNEDSRYGWIVEGYEKDTGKLFRYKCKRAVLATGTTDLSNKLGVPGEDSHSEWVTHDLNDLESRLDRLAEQQKLEKRVDPVLVIGAGLSAADAIMAARLRGISVLHVFRDSSSEWSKSGGEKKRHIKYDKLQELPSSMYPEYHKVYEMMADRGTNYPLYRALPGYTLVQLGSESNGHINISDERVVTLSSSDGRLHSFHVSVVAILIGYTPDLSYLENSGVDLGKFSEKPIDGKSNPIEVDDFTYEVIKAPRKGLYALGPLVGDNFVRYILGGAFGILVHILSTSDI